MKEKREDPYKIRKALVNFYAKRVYRLGQALGYTMPSIEEQGDPRFLYVFVLFDQYVVRNGEGNGFEDIKGYLDEVALTMWGDKRPSVKDLDCYLGILWRRAFIIAYRGEVLTQSEAAKVAGKTVSMIGTWIRRGQLWSIEYPDSQFKRQGRLRVLKSEVLEWAS